MVRPMRSTGVDSRAARTALGMMAATFVAAVALVPGASVAGAATPAAGPQQGYWLMTTDGQVLGYGSAAPGAAGPLDPLAKPTVCMSSTSDGRGYWRLGSDGGVFASGDAGFYGSTGGMQLNEPVVGMAPTPTGHGYWLVASDGGIFAFGDAGFYGSTGGTPLNRPVVGMASTPSGHGYWLAASDGGIFAFGDAGFYGSTGAVPLAQPVVGMASTPSGHGYWLAASDGGVFSFGDAGFYGSAGASPPAAPVVAIDAPGHQGGCLGAAIPTPAAVPGPGGPAGEGRWAPLGQDVGSTPAMYSTVLRPSPGVPAASVVWIDTGRTRLRQYAGSAGEPPGNFRYTTAVAGPDRASLLSGFNGGFHVTESGGGWYSEGQIPFPLLNGAASLVIDTNGVARVGVWGRDFGPSLAGVASVRQNLTVLVDHSAPAPNAGINSDWGAVVAGIERTCRSGLGVDRYGNLLYAAGPALYPADLARVLIAAGAVEAMEMDINCMWPLFTSFTQGSATNLAGWMYYPPSRYVAGSQRDFLAAFRR